jgi:hypothetical protein
MDAAGNWTYTPDTGFTGTDSFRYRVCDPAGECVEATITVVVASDTSGAGTGGTGGTGSGGGTAGNGPEPPVAGTVDEQPVVSPAVTGDLASTVADPLPVALAGWGLLAAGLVLRRAAPRRAA